MENIFRRTTRNKESREKTVACLKDLQEKKDRKELWLRAMYWHSETKTEVAHKGTHPENSSFRIPRYVLGGVDIILVFAPLKHSFN